MSSFSAACPHCGRVNPTAPQAILRDPPPPRPIQARITKPVPFTKPVESDEKETPSATPISPLGIVAGVIHWCRELAGEWRSLGRRQKTAARILFGLAAMTAAGFGFYVVLA